MGGGGGGERVMGEEGGWSTGYACEIIIITVAFHIILLVCVYLLSGGCNFCGCVMYVSM